jgi:hypothetical protein
MANPTEPLLLLRLQPFDANHQIAIIIAVTNFEIEEFKAKPEEAAKRYFEALKKEAA